MANEEARLRQTVTALEDNVLSAIEQTKQELSNADLRSMMLFELVSTMQDRDTDVFTVAELLEQAAGIIQTAMHEAQWDLWEGKPNPRATDLEEFRRLVSHFSNTARHLAQPMFGPARWPVSK